MTEVQISFAFGSVVGASLILVVIVVAQDIKSMIDRKKRKRTVIGRDSGPPG